MILKLPHDRIFFTSDTHYGHTENLTFFGRPFPNVEACDRAMIDNHNALVGPDDVVFHLGDFTWGGGADFALYIREQLNGQIHLIEGNHDQDVVPIYSSFESVHRYLEIGVEDADAVKGVQCINLFHFPIQDWNNARQGWWHLFGHSHGSTAPQLIGKNGGASIDVGVDAQNLCPVSYAQIKERFGRWKKLGYPNDYKKPKWVEQFS